MVRRVLIAPDSFGGTLTALEAAQAMRLGWLAVSPHDEVEVLPLSDGGEGLLDVMGRADSKNRVVRVDDARGRPRSARYLETPKYVVAEVAEACGLRWVAPAERDPWTASTVGVGHLLNHCLAEAGSRRLILGLGGSATIDVGAGLLSALGYDLLDARGDQLPPTLDQLERVVAVRAPTALPPMNGISVWADVSTPLVECVVRFGPQKGLALGEVDRATEVIMGFADVLCRDLGFGDVALLGGGAAGGMGWTLAQLGGETGFGAEALFQYVDVASRVAAADLVVTGEGRLDATSFEGKVLHQVIRLAQVHGRPVAAVVGQCALGDADGRGLAQVVEAAPTGPGPRPARDVKVAAQRLAAQLGPH